MGLTGLIRFCVSAQEFILGGQDAVLFFAVRYGCIRGGSMSELIDDNAAIIDHYEDADEHSRLLQGMGKLEFARTCDSIQRYAPAPPAVVLNISVTRWLAVHHVAQKSVSAPPG